MDKIRFNKSKKIYYKSINLFLVATLNEHKKIKETFAELLQP